MSPIASSTSGPVASLVRREGGKKAFLKNVVWRSVGRFYRPFMDPVDFSSVGRVVFVCKGNICRSPVAEYAFKRVSSLKCLSAGLDTTVGCLANERVVAIAAKHCLDLSRHKTTELNTVGLASSDLVVCMEPTHFFQLKKQCKNLKVVLLGRYGVPSKIYIHDPYGAGDDYAEGCVEYIIGSVEKLAKLMPKRSGE